jgi:hypothetical protein
VVLSSKSGWNLVVAQGSARVDADLLCFEVMDKGENDGM